MSKYRIRKGLFGKSVLQKLEAIEPWQRSFNPPPWAKTIYKWIDIPYDQAPLFLKEQNDE